MLFNLTCIQKVKISCHISDDYFYDTLSKLSRWQTSLLKALVNKVTVSVYFKEVTNVLVSNPLVSAKITLKVNKEFSSFKGTMDAEFCFSKLWSILMPSA